MKSDDAFFAFLVCSWLIGGIAFGAWQNNVAAGVFGGILLFMLAKK